MLNLVVFAMILLAVAPASPHPAPASSPSVSPAPAPLTPDQLFSRRALRRARLLIQMRVLQLRDERLECIREALRRQLPGPLWPEEPSPSRGSADAATTAERCTDLLKF